MTLWDGEHCQSCGKAYSIVYWLPDDVWEAITPSPDRPGAGLLCPPCADRRASKLGISLTWTARREPTKTSRTVDRP